MSGIVGKGEDERSGFVGKFPSGIKNAEQWRLNGNFTGSVDPIADDWELVDAPVGFGTIGSNMAVNSGLWTFPQTGIWQVSFHGHFIHTNVSFYNGVGIKTTTDNSTYAIAAVRYSQNAEGSNSHSSADVSVIVDVTDTTNVLVSFYNQMQNSGVTTSGTTASNQTSVTFIRLGDT